MTDFKQGDRVANQEGYKGLVLVINDSTCRVGFDDPVKPYDDALKTSLTIIPHSPSISTLPQAQRQIMQALHEKRPVKVENETHITLRDYGYITAEHKLTPYGDYMVRRWVEAGMPVDEPAPVVEAQESTPAPIIEAAIKQHEAGTLVLPTALGGDTLARNQEFDALKAKNAELEAENERLKDANSEFHKALRIKNEELEKAHETIERQRQELIDAKTKRVTLTPVGQTVERVISTSRPLDFEGKQGVFMTSFRPLLEQPKQEPATAEATVTTAIGEQMQAAVVTDLERMIASLPPEQKAEAIHRMRTAQVALNVIFGDFGTQFQENAS